ncbi:hypothetical protein D3C71_1841970 [compost metagenome]
MHAARRSPLQCLHDGLADGIVEHQVVQQVHTLAGLVDVFDQGLQRGVVVIEQIHRVAVDGHEIALALDQRHDLGGGRLRRGRPAQGRLQGLLLADHLGGLGLALHALAR